MQKKHWVSCSMIWSKKCFVLDIQKVQCSSIVDDGVCCSNLQLNVVKNILSEQLGIAFVEKHFQYLRKRFRKNAFSSR